MNYYIKIHNGKIVGELPLPPSVNKCYKNTRGGRSKTDEYKQFTEDVEKICLMSLDKPEITGNKWLRIEYYYYLPLFTSKGKKRIVDTGNFEKPLSDSLSAIKGFEDHKIKHIVQEKKDCEKRYCLIIISELG